MRFVYYITGHGFGHATRSLTIIKTLLAAAPAARAIVRSTVPPWFLRQSGAPAIELHPIDTDTGIVQIDAMALDDVATARRAAEFYSTFSERVAAEAAYLTDLKPAVVIGDVPPLAFAAAHAAGVPSIAIANFTWDWIYQAYDSFPRRAPGVIDQMQRAYGQTSCALRLPFAGGFEPMRDVTRDIPLVARRSRFGRDRVRQLLQLPTDRPVVLASFGGHRTSVPYDTIARRCHITLVLTDHELAVPAQAGNVRRLTATELAAHDLRYEDLVAAADIVVSKPGYGIVSECIANDTALLYTTRGRFAENDVMVESMGRVARTRFIEQEALREGDWLNAVEGLLAQPAPAERMRIDGADVAAAAVREFVTS